MISVVWKSLVSIWKIKIISGVHGNICYTVYQIIYEGEFFDDEYNTIELITVTKDDILYVD